MEQQENEKILPESHCKKHPDRVIKYIYIMQSGTSQDNQRCCSKCLEENKSSFIKNDNECKDLFIKMVKNKDIEGNQILVELKKQITNCLEKQKQRMTEEKSKICDKRYDSSTIERRMKEIIKEDFDAYTQMKILLEKLLFEDVYKELREVNKQKEFYDQIFKNTDAFELLSECKRVFFNKIWSQGILNEKQEQIKNIQNWTQDFFNKSDLYLNNCVNVMNRQLNQYQQQFTQRINKQKQFVQEISNNYSNFLNGENQTEIQCLDPQVLVNLQLNNQIQKYIYYQENQDKIEYEYSSFLYSFNSKEDKNIMKNYELLPADIDSPKVENELKKIFPQITSVQRKNLKCYTCKLQYQQNVLTPSIDTRKEEQLDLLVEDKPNKFSYTIFRGNERIDFEDLDKVKAYYYNFDKAQEIIYEGRFNEYLERDGKGVLKKVRNQLSKKQQILSKDNQNITEDKDYFYKGDWKNGLFHGKGEIFVEKVNEYVEGQFKNGKMNGDMKLRNEVYQVDENIVNCSIF